MLLEFLSILATCIAAVTGALAAGRKQMDFFGVIVIAIITALGGGSMRDVLINHYPLVWVSHPFYIIITASCAVITIIIAKQLVKVSRLFLFLDALGLAVFVVVGCQTALLLSMSPLIVIICGMVTGICGGMLRDILCNDIPLVLRKELYATVAMAGALLYLILDNLHCPHPITVGISIIGMFSFRIWAIIYTIEMPKFDYSHD